MTNDGGPITPAYVLTAIGFWFVAVPAALYLLGRGWQALIGRWLDREVQR